MWTEEDRAWALALAEVEADTCPDCGEPWSEVTDPKNEFAYEANLVMCHACATSAKKVRAHQDGHGSADGLHVHIEKRNQRRG
ncbi:hypothetical protein [Streptomyces sp. PA03-2a]|uniref:hypothetical protein n=1 Tax=Streptomyces sp. PA03-2a TaxID=3028701 RepID=UPI0029B07E00|nr:hypothetical protein [Streptomyces sp. PA03-2a]MDX2731177.1 hypothetical protein [Streptomyces sp. PA03-2a]